MRGLAAWAALAVYTALVIWSSVETQVQVHPFVARHDKIFHGLQYALLLALAIPAFRFAGFLRPAAGSAFLYTLVIGFLTELLQAYVPSRETSMGDWLADFGGAAFTLAIYFLLRRRVPEGVFNG